jgi:hypothetical protein
MAAMAAAKAEFLGQSVVASKSDVVAQKQGGALRVVSLFSKGKQVAKQVKKAVPKAVTAAKKAVPKATTAVKRTAAKVNRPNNEELAKWYGKYTHPSKPRESNFAMQSQARHFSRNH